MVTMIVDNKKVKVREGSTLLEILREMEIKIPTLCHHESVSPYGACRLCLVEVTISQRTMLAASCLFQISEGLVVKTSSERVLKARKMVAELLLARCPDVPKIKEIAREVGVKKTRFPKKDEKCILCGLCVRGCHEIAGVGVIDFANRGVYTEVISPFKIPSEACVGCTTCIYLCPTDAILLNEIRRLDTSHHFNLDAS